MTNCKAFAVTFAYIFALNVSNKSSFLESTPIRWMKMPLYYYSNTNERTSSSSERINIENKKVEVKTIEISESNNIHIGRGSRGMFLSWNLRSCLCIPSCLSLVQFGLLNSTECLMLYHLFTHRFEFSSNIQPTKWPKQITPGR